MRNSKVSAGKKPNAWQSSSHRSPFFQNLMDCRLPLSFSYLHPSNASSFRWRALFLWLRLRPEAQEQLRQIFHARPTQTLQSSRLLERSRHGTPLFVIPPQLRLEAFYRNMLIQGSFRGTLKLSLPMVSLVWMPLQIIEHPLLAPVQAHFAQRAGRVWKNNCKTRACGSSAFLRS